MPSPGMCLHPWIEDSQPPMLVVAHACRVMGQKVSTFAAYIEPTDHRITVGRQEAYRYTCVWYPLPCPKCKDAVACTSSSVW